MGCDDGGLLTGWWAGWMECSRWWWLSANGDQRESETESKFIGNGFCIEHKLPRLPNLNAATNLHYHHLLWAQPWKDSLGQLRMLHLTWTNWPWCRRCWTGRAASMEFQEWRRRWSSLCHSSSWVRYGHNLQYNSIGEMLLLCLTRRCLGLSHLLLHRREQERRSGPSRC